MKTWRGKAGAAGVLLLLGLAVFLTRERSPVPILWTVPAPFLGAELPVSDDGTVYVKGFGVVRAYDSNGKLKWRSPLGIFVYSNPVLGSDGTVYLHEGRAHFIDAPKLTGTNEGVVALRPDGSLKWRFPISKICEQAGTGVAFSLDDRGTLYFETNNNFFDPRTLIAVGLGGKERWRFRSEDHGGQPVQIAGDREFLLSDGTNISHLRSFDAEGRPGPELTFPGYIDHFSLGSDGTLYVPGLRGATLAAVSAMGSNVWEFKSTLRPTCAPTVGPDGSVYFMAQATNRESILVALSKSGQEKWEFAMGRDYDSHPPTVASDGTLFMVSPDPKLMALNPDGTLRWVFVPRKHIRLRLRKSWDGWMEELKEDFGNANVFASPPTLTTNGILYVAFGGAYDRLYALNVGVGLATNSPWPMRSGNARLTRQAGPAK